MGFARLEAARADGRLYPVAPAEKDSVVVRLEFAQRDELIEGEPDVYYVKEHYLNYPCVLARLKHIHPDALRGLLLMGWEYVNARAPKKPASKTRKRKAR